MRGKKMTQKKLKTGRRYVVVTPSDDGTFEVGDHIKLNRDGTISCIEAQGWIEACDADEAIAGAEVVVDQEWAEKRRKKLRAELENLAMELSDN